MCTNNVTQQVYKELTMPPFACPNKNDPAILEHTQMYKKRTVEAEWKWLQSGLLCRIVIKASDKISGKLVVRVDEVGKEALAVFQQPNSFPPEYGSKGIIENNQVYLDKKKGSQHFIPTDWTMTIVYSFNRDFRLPAAGKVLITSWVEDWEKKDAKLFTNGYFAFTKDVYVSPDEQARRQKEIEEKAKAAVEEAKAKSQSIEVDEKAIKS